MFSSLVAQGHRTLMTCWLAVMIFVFSLATMLSFLFRRGDKPLLLPYKMKRSWNWTPTVRGIGRVSVFCNDSFGSNGGKQRENLLPSCRTGSDEPRLLLIWNFYNDAHAREVRPIGIQAGSDIADIRSWRNAHFVEPLRNYPRFERFVARYIIKIATSGPRNGKRRCQNDDEMKAPYQERPRAGGDLHSR